MGNKRGIFISIDGTDGAGKKTQTKLLLDRLLAEGYRAESFSFPQYGKPSAHLVEEYLNGTFGDPTALDPRLASVLFAIDRVDLSGRIKKLLDEGAIVVTDRYVAANSGHQGGKIADPFKREGFLRWLYHLEYEILGIPKPDHVLILHVPAKVGQERISQKESREYILGGKTHDGHEKSLDHQRAAEESYLWLAKQFPEDHLLIRCVEDDNRLLSADEVHEKIWQTVRPILHS